MADDNKDTAGTEGGSVDQFKTVLEMLAKKGISLPEDTTTENVWDRLVVALTALEGANPSEMEEEEEEADPAESKVVQPTGTNSPIAMSLRAQSIERQYLAEKTTGVQQRIQSLVANGHITPAYARTLEEDHRRVPLSLNAKGELKTNPVLIKLEALEALPANSAWSPRGQRTKLSNAEATAVERPDQILGKEPGEVDTTPEGKKKLVDDFFAMKNGS